MKMVANQIIKDGIVIYRAGSAEPTSILKTNEGWKISINWSLSSKSLISLDDLTHGYWHLSVFLEPLGQETISDLNITELDIPVGSGSISLDLLSFNTVIDIASGKVPAGRYRLVTTLIMLNVKVGKPMGLSGFIESPLVEFQDPVKESETQVFGDARLSVDEFSLSVVEGRKLSLPYLSNVVIPYLKAITDLQDFINQVRGVSSVEIAIVSISQNSPISVSLEGASDALQVVKDSVVPWRRKHVEIMARLQEQAKLAEIEKLKAEVLEKRARAEKARIEATKKHEEVERMRIENDKSRLELQHAKVQLSIDIMDHLVQNLSENEKILYISKLLPSLDILLSGDLEIE